MKAKSFKDLRIWQKSMEIVNTVYSLTKRFPREEIFGLKSQMRRSAVSMPSNIAEGFRRFHNKEFKQFLFICLGSCAELETQLIIASQQNYIPKDDTEKLIAELEMVSRMITSLRKKINL